MNDLDYRRRTTNRNILVSTGGSHSWHTRFTWVALEIPLEVAVRAIWKVRRKHPVRVGQPLPSDRPQDVYHDQVFGHPFSTCTGPDLECGVRMGPCLDFLASLMSWIVTISSMLCKVSAVASSCEMRYLSLPLPQLNACS